MGCISCTGKTDENSQANDLSKNQSDESKFGNKPMTSLLRDTKFTKPSYDPLTDFPEITPEQKELVVQSWKEITSGPQALRYGSFAFMRVFLLAPEVTESFRKMWGDKTDPKDETDLLKNTVMRSHIESFNGFIGELVDHIGDEELCLKKCSHLGRRHFKYPAHPKYLSAFIEGFLFAIEKMLFPNVDVALISAWEAFMARLAHKWAVGYFESEEALEDGIPLSPSTDNKSDVVDQTIKDHLVIDQDPTDAICISVSTTVC